MEGEAPNATEEILVEEEIEESSTANSTDDEIAMADERKDFYLPPKSGGVVTYDGKIVQAAPAPSLPARKSSFDISKLPQYVPFRGEIPPLTQTVSVENLPQLKNTKSAPVEILPPSGFPNPPSVPSTRLSPVKSFDRYDPQASEVKETVLEVTNESNVGAIHRETRRKRSPDHIPGHEGPDHDHDHDHHDHTHNNALNLLPNFFIFFGLSYVLRFL